MINVHLNVQDSIIQRLMCMNRENLQRVVCHMRDGLRLYMDTTGEEGKKTLETGEERHHVTVRP
jgi:hypothetical protein